MSFTMLLLLAYIVMGVGSFIAFKRKHKAIGIALLLVIVLSVLILEEILIYEKRDKQINLILHCISSVFHSVSYWLYEWK